MPISLPAIAQFFRFYNNAGMDNRNIFENISALDHRYSLSESDVFGKLSAALSEEAAVRSCVQAEIALIKAHLAVSGSLDADAAAVLDAAGDAVQPEEVYAEEQKTQHNIRALVNVLKTKMPPKFAPLVHFAATSADILDTALAVRMKNAVQGVVAPELIALERALCVLAEREAETPQVGRTHGQHAVPITFGWAVAEFVCRLGKSILQIGELARGLKGKLSGPVGAYNGAAMIAPDPEELERRYLAFLSLEPSEYSHQLTEPEPLLRLLLECNVAFGIIANLADDLRHLQRSEIGEVFEYFGSAQVGSSTMPQKRNPWNSEHVKSLWKAMCPRVITFYMDQISEHQRDLTNSASQRFIADYLAGFVMAVSRMKEVVSRLQPDRAAMAENLTRSGGKVAGGILAEPAYLLLASAGESDAHEIIRKLTLRAEQSGKSFYETLAEDAAIWRKISARLAELDLPPAATFFSNPAHYAGRAAAKTNRIAQKYAALMDKAEREYVLPSSAGTAKQASV